MNWVVYILKCNDGSLYTGITNDLAKRLFAHEKGIGAKYTRGKAPFSIVYKEFYKTRSEATKREAQIKGLTRRQKLELI